MRGSIAVLVIVGWVVASSGPGGGTEALFADLGIQRPTEPAPAPPLILSDLRGRTVRLSDFRGRVVLLGFFTTT